MKRLSTALAPTLMTGALLGISAVSQAQTNTMTLVGTIPDQVVPGESYTLTLTGETPGTDVATTFQTLFRYDPAFLNVTFTVTNNDALGLSRIRNNFQLTETIASGAYAGENVMKMTTYGIFGESGNGIDLAPNTVLGTFRIDILASAPLGEETDFGLSNALITDVNFETNRQSTITSTPAHGTSFAGAGQIRPGAFRVSTVPGPSSLAVFALGGLAPAMALIRRRRAAK